MCVSFQSVQPLLHNHGSRLCHIFARYQVLYCGRAYDNLKMMAGGYAVHEQQAILLTTVVVFYTFCMENKLTTRGVWQ